MKKMVFMNLLVFCLLVCVVSIHAQVKIPPDRDTLLVGESPGQTLVAEQNGFPSPKTILALKEKLNLTKDQLRKIDEMMTNLPISASVKGEDIVAAEEDLAKMFASGNVNEKTLRMKLEHIGKLRAELRLTHLQVYLRVKQILTVKQWERLKELQSSEVK